MQSVGKIEAAESLFHRALQIFERSGNTAALSATTTSLLTVSAS
jgi:hypothetical protein